MKRVVVTGIGMITSLGLDAKSSFDNIIAGKCGIRTIQGFDATGYPVQIAAEIEGFDPTTVMDAKEVKKADRFIQLGLKAAKEAMADAGLTPGSYDAERFGISGSSGIGGLPSIQKCAEILIAQGHRRVSPFFIPSALVNLLGGFIGIEYGLKGPNLASVTACAAGVHSITDAAKAIMLGQADRMLAVSSEAAVCQLGVAGFAAMKALSTRNDEPAKSSRPFDADRDGFVLGEGAGALVLEEYEAAKARGAKIYAELIGFGESGDAHHITTPAPEGEGAYRAMRAAMQMAESRCGEPVSIDYINAHGTSTPFGDAAETMAIKKIFGSAATCPPVSSTKGATGHCLGGAGTVEAVISLMGLAAGVMPPTINLEKPDPECDLDYVPNVARKKELTTVMSNSFGFGGTNAVVIFQKI